MYRQKNASGTGPPYVLHETAASQQDYINKIYQSNISTLPETNIAHEYRPSQTKSHISTAIFQGQAVSSRECTIGIFCLMLADDLMSLTPSQPNMEPEKYSHGKREIATQTINFQVPAVFLFLGCSGRNH